MTEFRAWRHRLDTGSYAVVRAIVRGIGWLLLGLILLLSVLGS